MRKLIYTSILSFLIFIAILMPLVNGLLLKKNYLHLFDVINQDKRVKVEVLTYQEGWFSSTAKIRVTIFDNIFIFPQKATTFNEKEFSPFTFLINQNIKHGPIVYDRIKKSFVLAYANIQSDFYFPEQLQMHLLGKLSPTGIFQIDLLSKFHGKWIGQFTIPMLLFSTEKIDKINFNGSNGEFKIKVDNNRIKRVKINILINSITIKGIAVNPLIT